MNEHRKIETLTDNLKIYINTNIELNRLEATERLSVLGSIFISYTLIVPAGILFILFISLSLAFYLSRHLGGSDIGFAIVAGVYLLLGIILILSRKRLLEKPIRDRIIREALIKNQE